MFLEFESSQSTKLTKSNVIKELLLQTDKIQNSAKKQQERNISKASPVKRKSKFSSPFLLKVSLLVQYSSKKIIFGKIEPIFNTEK